MPKWNAAARSSGGIRPTVRLSCRCARSRKPDLDDGTPSPRAEAEAAGDTSTRSEGWSMTLVYKPFSIISGLVAGRIASRMFGVIWGVIDEQEPPSAEHRNVPLWKLALALLV